MEVPTVTQHLPVVSEQSGPAAQGGPGAGQPPQEQFPHFPRDDSQLWKRLEHLELRNQQLARQARRFRQAMVAAVALVSLLAVFGAAGNSSNQRLGPSASFQVIEAKTVQAEQFLLRTTDGLVVGKLGEFPGGPGLAIFDPQGKPRVGLIATDDGPQVCLYGPQAMPRLTLSVNDHLAGLAISDRHGHQRTSLELSSQDEPAFKIHDSSGQLQAVLGASENPESIAETALVFFDSQHRQRQFLGLSSDHPLVVQRDCQGRVRASLGVTPLEEGLILHGPQGATRTLSAQVPQPTPQPAAEETPEITPPSKITVPQATLPQAKKPSESAASPTPEPILQEPSALETSRPTFEVPAPKLSPWDDLAPESAERVTGDSVTDSEPSLAPQAGPTLDNARPVGHNDLLEQPMLERVSPE